MKITLTIAGLLSLAVILYPANPTLLATVNTPNGVAASGTELIATEYCCYYAYGVSDAQGFRAEATRFANEMKNS